MRQLHDIPELLAVGGLASSPTIIDGRCPLPTACMKWRAIRDGEGANPTSFFFLRMVVEAFADGCNWFIIPSVPLAYSRAVLIQKRKFGPASPRLLGVWARYNALVAELTGRPFNLIRSALRNGLSASRHARPEIYIQKRSTINTLPNNTHQGGNLLKGVGRFSRKSKTLPFSCLNIKPWRLCVYYRGVTTQQITLNSKCDGQPPIGNLFSSRWWVIRPGSSGKMSHENKANNHTV